MQLTPDTWFTVTMTALMRVATPLKSKEFLTEFDPSMPGTPENVEIIVEQIKALMAREQAVAAIKDFLVNAIPEVPAIINELEQGKDPLNAFRKK